MQNTESYNHLGPTDPYYAIKRSIRANCKFKPYLGFRTGAVCDNQITIAVYDMVE